MSEPRPRRFPILPVAVFVALVAARFPVAAAHQDIWYPFEIFSGNVAAGLLDGLRFELSQLTIIEHIRGGPLFGLLLAPLYALCGESTLTLKLVPLLWHALTVALLVGGVQRWLCRKAAVGVALAFVFAPPIVAKLAVVGFASHNESSLAFVLALLVAWPILLDGRGGPGERGPWLRFGLVFGFACFFHVQAVLGCLIVAGLLLLGRPGAFLRGLPALLLGAALTGWPSWLFEGGAFSVSKTMMDGEMIQPVNVTSGARYVSGVGAKLSELAGHGLAPLLEFGELGEAWGRPAAYLVGWLLVLCAGLVVCWERAGLLALFPALIGRNRRPLSKLAFFPLHAVAVLGLLVVSNMQLNVWFVGTGLASRRLAPLFFSLLVMAGIVFGRAFGRPGGARWLAALLLTLYCGAGAAGLVAASSTAAPNRLAHRGEYYEWFTRQLNQAADNDLQTWTELVQRVDRGDARFRVLRFRPPGIAVPGRAPLSALGAAASPDQPLELRLYRLLAVGRAVGFDREQAKLLAGRMATTPLRGPERVALLHGVGMGTTVPRPAVTADKPRPPPWLSVLAGQFEGADRWAVFEGYGLAQGLSYDPYNRFMNSGLVSLRGLPSEARAGFFQGLGWGISQRYIEAPTGDEADFEGLAVLEFIEPEDRAVFLRGLRRDVLPAESRALAEQG